MKYEDLCILLSDCVCYNFFYNGWVRVWFVYVYWLVKMCFMLRGYNWSFVVFK